MLTIDLCTLKITPGQKDPPIIRRMRILEGLNPPPIPPPIPTDQVRKRRMSLLPVNQMTRNNMGSHLIYPWMSQTMKPRPPHLPGRSSLPDDTGSIRSRSEVSNSSDHSRARLPEQDLTRQIDRDSEDKSLYSEDTRSYRSHRDRSPLNRTPAVERYLTENFPESTPGDL